MKIKQTGDSKVDKIIKKSEEAAAPHSTEATKGKTSQKKNSELIGAIVILALLGLSLVQSIELISLRNQLKNGQFGASAGAPAAGDAQNLPAQQGGC